MSNKHIYDNIMQINNMILNINYKSNINVEEKWIKMNFCFLHIPQEHTFELK